MATAKKNDVPEFDFENFDEEAGTASSVEALAPKFAWGEGVFGGRFPDGEVIHVRLDPPLSVFNDVVELAKKDGIGADEQLHALLVAIGEESKARLILSKGSVGAIAFAQKFFETFQKVTKASLGE